MAYASIARLSSLKSINTSLDEDGQESKPSLPQSRVLSSEFRDCGVRIETATGGSH